MLTRPLLNVMASVLGVGAITVSGCSAQNAPTTPEVDGLSLSVPADAVVLRPFAEVTPGHCLGSPYLVDGQVETTDCATADASRIAAVTTFGASVPSGDPSIEEVTLAAESVCDPLIRLWAADQTPAVTTGLQFLVYPKTWEGAQTPLICATRVGELLSE